MRPGGPCFKIVKRLALKDVQLAQEDIVFASPFLTTLFQRSRKVRAQYTGPEVVQAFAHLTDDAFVRERQHELLQSGTLIPFDQLRSAIVKSVNEVVNDPAQIQFHEFTDRSAKVALGLASKPWSLVRSDERSFITSDSPIFPLTMGTGGGANLGGPLLHAETAVFLAPSPHTLLIMGPEKASWNPVAAPDLIRDIRHATVSSADRAVYSTEKSEALQKLVEVSLGSFHYNHKNRPPPPESLP